MSKRLMVLLRASPLILLLLLFVSTSAMANSPSTQITNPDAVAAPTVNVSPSGGGPVPGCPPAKHLGPWKVPADGGKAIRHFKGLYVFNNVWWNNNHPSVIGADWNHGAPSWDQAPIKFMLKGSEIRTRGMGGEAYKYVNNAACRYNLRFEIRHGSATQKRLQTLVNKQLVVRLD